MTEAKKLPQYFAAVCVCIGSLGTGTVLAWTSNITDDLKAGKLGGLKITDFELSWVGSLLPLGAVFACVPIGWMADSIGRKPTVLLTSIPFVIGWALITFPFHISMIWAGRFLTGVAGGSFCVTAPVYTSEIAQTEIRGRLGTFFQLFITIGILLVNVFGYLLPMMVYNLFCLSVPIGFAILFVFQSETPVYSLKKGRTDQAEKAFKRLRGSEYNPADEIKAIQEQIAIEQTRKGFWEGMKTKAAKKATFICYMLMVFQQFSGINAVIFYSKDIFTAAESSVPSHWCTIIIGAVQVVATIVSSLLIEKVGRKILLMFSEGLMALSCFMLAIFFSLKNRDLIDVDAVKSISFLPVLSLVLFIIAFSMGAGPLPWVATSELIPPDVMAKCTSGAGVTNWFLAFLVTMFYHKVAEAIGNDITFYAFAAVSLTGVFFVLILMPETKGKTIAEIQAELQG